MATSPTGLARMPIRRYIAAAAVAVSAAAAVVLITPAVSHAADTVNCGTPGTGKTSNLAQGPNGQHPVGGTIWTKKPPGCLDLNLVKVSASDGYWGWLEMPNGTWFGCHPVAGVNFRNAPPLPKVLCSNVATGTQMAIVQRSNTQRTVNIQR